VVFYTIIFAGCAVLLVVAGVTYMRRSRRTLDAEKRSEGGAAHAARKQRNAERSQSRKARRKR
jgi:hypothetical protein